MKTILTKLINYRHFAFLLLFMIVGTYLHAQLSQSQLEKFYRKNNTKALENVFFQEFQETKDTFRKIATNDTLLKINELFNTVVLPIAKSADVEYFFLQSNSPRIFIDDKRYLLHEPFAVDMNDSSIRAMRFDPELILTLLSFIGKEPNNDVLRKHSIHKSNNHSCFKRKKAKIKINKYNNRLKFISGNLILPMHWGKLDKSLVPYMIKYIQFDKSLTHATLEYDFTWCGATEEYTLEEGKWVKTNEIMNWIE